MKIHEQLFELSC